MLDSYRYKRCRNCWLVGRALWNREESQTLDDIQAFVALATPSRNAVPYCQTEKAIHEIPVKTYLLEDNFIPSLEGVYRIVVRTRAWIRSLRVLNALQAHVPTGSGKIPKLSSLGLPAEATVNPFTGEPLHVKKLPQGWMVYSVGPNLQDDGGKLDDLTSGDVGVGPPPAATESAKK